ncbi:MAG: hypothetical protein HN522_06525 [Flavobacteriales bacterium]|jgi:hypothetical protein|nr:hypothetical protein [Flavobacteriales bacterium]MBT6169768.1 hypothetical protein [Flavobacteriaceae bacterium]
MSNQWRKYQGVLVSAKAPHQEIFTQGLNSEIKKNNAFFARWITNFDCKKELDFWYLIQDKKMEINDYSSNTRNQIRKGLKNFEIRKITLDKMIESAYVIYKTVFQLYNTANKIKSLQEFNDDLLPAFDYWGVYRNNMLVGFAQNRVFDDCCDYSTIKILPIYAKEYPFYALFYTMNNYYLAEQKLRYVTDGTKSISHQTNIQEFLVKKFKFRKAYCYLHIKYNPFFGLMVSCLFPFRKILSVFHFSFIRNINSILLQEKIRRNCQKELLC